MYITFFNILIYKIKKKYQHEIVIYTYNSFRFNILLIFLVLNGSFAEEKQDTVPYTEKDILRKYPDAVRFMFGQDKFKLYFPKL